MNTKHCYDIVIKGAYSSVLIENHIRRKMKMSDEMNKMLEQDDRDDLQEIVESEGTEPVSEVEEVAGDTETESVAVNLKKEAAEGVPQAAPVGEDDSEQNIFDWESSKEAKRAEEIARREKEKFQQRQQKEMKKAEKIAEKKVKKQEKKAAGKGGNVLIGAVKVASAAVLFGVVSVGVMYFLGDELDLFDNDKRIPSQVITNTQVGQKVESESTSVITTDKNNKINVSSVTAVDVSDIVEEVMPSVVSITSKTIVQSNRMEDWFFDYYFGFGNNGNGGSDGDQYEEETGAGSGIIIGQNDTELLVVTNNHVVEGADSLEVQFIDGKSVDAIIKGTNSTNDLAVVAIKLSDIKTETKDAIKVATLGDSDKLEVGEGAIAIGNALGYGQSVTVGVISAVERDVTIDSNTMQLIQTDAAINPGNSGGALLNMQGEVIGINAAKYSSDSVEGMGFAIPVTSVSDIIEGLMNRETLTKVDEDKKGYLNIYGRDVTEDLATEFNAPKGVLIRDVIKGGAAEQAGLEKLDIITAINDQPIASMTELQNMLEYYEEGTKVTLTVQYLDGKEYKEKKVEVKLGGVME